MKQLIVLIIALLVPVMAWGQGYDKNRGRKTAQDDKAVQLNIEGLAIGFGSFFDNEGVTFSREALYATIQYHAVGFNFIKEGMSTGFQFEGQVGRLFTQNLTDENGRVQFLDNFSYRFWSVTRVPISAIPIGRLQGGSLGRMFTGIDLLITEDGPEDFTGDFDKRFVIGGDLGKLGPGNIVVEIYSLLKNVPISFVIFYGF